MRNDLPNGWEAVPLKDLLTPRSDRVSPQSMPNAPFIGMENVEPHTNRLLETVPASTMASNAARFCEGDVLYGRMRPYLNKVVSPSFDGLASAEFIVFPKNEVVDSRFLLWRLSSNDFTKFACSQYEGDRPRVKFDQLGNFELLVPPANEQARIVEKLEELLSDLDAGVAELKAAQRKLAQYRQSLLKSAVEGALTADWRAAHGKPQETGAELLQRILSQRRARWEQKQLGKFDKLGKVQPKDWRAKYSEPVAAYLNDLPRLPKGWTWASVDEAAAETLIGLDRGQEYQSTTGRVGYIKMNNVSMAGEVDTNSIVRIDADEEEIRRYEIFEKDLLFNTRNSKELVGKVGLVRSVNGATVYNNNLMRVRFDGVVAPEFACYQLCGPEFRGRMEKIKKATTSVAAVYAKDLLPLAIAVPPMEEQVEIVRCLDDAISGINQQEAAVEFSLKQAAAQRKNLLKAAFAGQLVPQDPNDEPAGELLARIRAERAGNDGSAPRRRRKTA